MQAVLASRGAAGIRLGLELGRGRQHGFGQPQGAGPLRRGGISDEDEQAAEDTLTPWMCEMSIDQHLQRARENGAVALAGGTGAVGAAVPSTPISTVSDQHAHGMAVKTDLRR